MECLLYHTQMYVIFNDSTSNVGLILVVPSAPIGIELIHQSDSSNRLIKLTCTSVCMTVHVHNLKGDLNNFCYPYESPCLFSLSLSLSLSLSPSLSLHLQGVSAQDSRPHSYILLLHNISLNQKTNQCCQGNLHVYNNNYNNLCVCK